METKICSKTDCHLAGIEQDISNFEFRKDTQKHRNVCKICQSKQSKTYKENNKEKIIVRQKKWYQKNKKPLKRVYFEGVCEECGENKLLFTSKYGNVCKECSHKKSQSNYYQKNKSEINEKSKKTYNNTKEYQTSRRKKYRQENAKEIKNRRNKKAKIERKNNPSFRLKSNISRVIRNVIKKNGGSKGGQAFSKYMDYTAEELKLYLEKLFEPWMNWNNQGVYKEKEWNDSDQATWKWQIDHIIPQSYLPYSSVEDDNFKKCWALSNLRPLSAKQNIFDGNRKNKGNK